MSEGTTTAAARRAALEEVQDLGFGAVLSREHGRLLNRDGSFNVRRVGMGTLESLSAYHYLLTISWRRFLLFLVVGFVSMNALFGLAYVACGPDALAGVAMDSLGSRFLEAFFFSVHTASTIGYGDVYPSNLAAHLLVVLEALSGLLSFGLGAALVFARLARPTARIIFSEHAVIAPYRGISAFEFRTVNARSTQLVEVEAKVVLARRRPGSATGMREFLELGLERRRVAFFPLSWTVVHPIDESSPLYGMGPAELVESEAEFLVLLSGYDETASQSVHARTSYIAGDVQFGVRFANIFEREDGSGPLTMDVRAVHRVEPAS